MDIKQNIDYKLDNISQYYKLGSTKYDYAKYGVLTRCLPKILFNKGNAVLVSFLQLTDIRLVMMMKYIDKLKHFKHITYYK